MPEIVPAARRKSGLLSLYENVSNPVKAVEPYAKNGVHLVRAEGEALATGAALAFLEQRLLGGSLDYKGYPVDGILAALGLLATMSLSTDDQGLAVDARNITADLTAIFAYRQSAKYLKARAEMPTSAPRVGGDTISAIAAELGL